LLLEATQDIRQTRGSPEANASDVGPNQGEERDENLLLLLETQLLSDYKHL
jgi:hypothetical protein